MTIWKFMLPFASEPIIQMPAEAAVLHAGMQGGHICLWAMVNQSADVEPRRFLIVGTGGELPTEGMWSYVGTVQQGGHDEPQLVWHIFEPVIEQAVTLQPMSRFSI